MTKKQPINAGMHTHDGKCFHMFAKGTHNHKKGYRPPTSNNSGKSYSITFPEGKRRKKQCG